MSVPAVISLVTLGVTDVRAATRFYQGLGFELASSSVEGEVSFFRTKGGLLAVWGVDDLRRDAHAEQTPTAGAFRGVALAVNVDSTDAVDRAIETARAAGAEIVKPPETVEWGGYQGYFADPDGHLWEVAYNPFWPIGPDGLPQLP
jgi:predicted lactoylglutathione lyase